MVEPTESSSNDDIQRDVNDPQQKKQINFWNTIQQLGFVDVVQRVGTVVLMIALVAMVIWVMSRYYLPVQGAELKNDSSAAEATMQAVGNEEVEVALPDMGEPYAYGAYDEGLARLTKLHTDLPSRPRWEVTTYTVEEGDTIFGIGLKFNLKPETVMWANYHILIDNPHALKPGQELFILPVDGTYHSWHAGDGLNGVAEYFGVEVEEIINFPGNNLDEETIGDYSNPNIEADTWLIIPGGRREYISWSAPLITRETAAQASIFGPGACGAILDGPIGTGTMIWPTVERYLSGYHYSPETNHLGIDIGGRTGYAIWSVDAGVVVYSGWNNFGYGNVVVIDHGNGWQSLYAHLDYINYGCGQYVYSGDIIGGMGSTGNSSGPHLHFELRHTAYGRPNPMDWLN